MTTDESSLSDGQTMADDELAWFDAVGQAELVRRGDVSATELVEAAIARIERLDPSLNAVVTREFERAMRTAQAGPPDGPFAGVPFLLKDLVAEWEGVRFTEGSRFLLDHISSGDQELTRRYRRAGLIMLGKTNTPEFGIGPTCEPTLFGPTRNPWDVTRTAGGSSGGSAAAVASGMVPMAHGADAGGSIRFPASCCGLFGLKPTRARLPLGPEYGDVFSGLAVEHALTRSVRDSAVLLDATAGSDVGDPYRAPRQQRLFADEVGVDPGQLRIAFSATVADGRSAADCLAALEDAVSLCDELGHELVECDLPELVECDLPGLDERVGAALETVYGAAVAWIVGYWIRKLGREPGPDEIEPGTRALWEDGRRVTAGDYLLAVEELQRLTRTVAHFFADVDLWLTPTLSEPPVPLAELGSTNDEPLRTFERVDSFSRFPAWMANVTENPAMSVPLYRSPTLLPIGVHFLGRFGDEATLLRLASQLEQARPWSPHRPTVTR